MIEVTASEGLLVYLAVMGVGLGAAAIWDGWRSRRQHWQVSEDRLARCPRCGCTFIVVRTVREANCPRCGVPQTVGKRGGRGRV